MGGRGSSFGVGSGSIEGRISSIEKEIEGLGVKMASLSRSAAADHGAMNAAERKQYNRMLERTRSLKNQRTKLHGKLARARQASEGDRKAFVNGFGEATRRDITSQAYESAQRRQRRSVLRNMGY